MKLSGHACSDHIDECARNRVGFTSTCQDSEQTIALCMIISRSLYPGDDYSREQGVTVDSRNMWQRNMLGGECSVCRDENIRSQTKKIPLTNPQCPIEHNFVISDQYSVFFTQRSFSSPIELYKNPPELTMPHQLHSTSTILHHQTVS